jgi:hypothetical protein
MNPPVLGPFFRKSLKDHYLDNIPIRQGTAIQSMSLANQYNP